MSTVDDLKATLDDVTSRFDAAKRIKDDASNALHNHLLRDDVFKTFFDTHVKSDFLDSIGLPPNTTIPDEMYQVGAHNLFQNYEPVWLSSAGWSSFGKQISSHIHPVPESVYDSPEAIAKRSAAWNRLKEAAAKSEDWTRIVEEAPPLHQAQSQAFEEFQRLGDQRASVSTDYAAAVKAAEAQAKLAAEAEAARLAEAEAAAKEAGKLGNRVRALFARGTAAATSVADSGRAAAASLSASAKSIVPKWLRGKPPASVELSAPTTEPVTLPATESAPLAEPALVAPIPEPHTLPTSASERLVELEKARDEAYAVVDAAKVAHNNHLLSDGVFKGLFDEHLRLPFHIPAGAEIPKSIYSSSAYALHGDYVPTLVKNRSWYDYELKELIPADKIDEVMGEDRTFAIEGWNKLKAAAAKSDGWKKVVENAAPLEATIKSANEKFNTLFYEHKALEAELKAAAEASGASAAETGAASEVASLTPAAEVKAAELEKLWGARETAKQAYTASENALHNHLCSDGVFERLLREHLVTADGSRLSSEAVLNEEFLHPLSRLLGFQIPEGEAIETLRHAFQTDFTPENWRALKQAAEQSPEWDNILFGAEPFHTGIAAARQNWTAAEDAHKTFGATMRAEATAEAERLAAHGKAEAARLIEAAKKPAAEAAAKAQAEAAYKTFATQFGDAKKSVSAAEKDLAAAAKSPKARDFVKRHIRLKFGTSISDIGYKAMFKDLISQKDCSAQWQSQFHDGLKAPITSDSWKVMQADFNSPAMDEVRTLLTDKAEKTLAAEQALKALKKAPNAAEFIARFSAEEKEAGKLINRARRLLGGNPAAAPEVVEAEKAAASLGERAKALIPKWPFGKTAASAEPSVPAIEPVPPAPAPTPVPSPAPAPTPPVPEPLPTPEPAAESPGLLKRAWNRIRGKGGLPNDAAPPIDTAPVPEPAPPPTPEPLPAPAVDPIIAPFEEAVSHASHPYYPSYSSAVETAGKQHNVKAALAIGAATAAASWVAYTHARATEQAKNGLADLQ